MLPLAEWLPFYTLVGAAAGTLTGLQFIVVTLIADMPARPAEIDTSNAFATPTIVHFVGVLLLAASVVTPWHHVRPPALLWAAGGLAGLGYTLRVIRRMRRQDSYRPVFEDWAFHALLPLLCYASLILAGAVAVVHIRAALFTLAAATLGLLCVAIHNCWDNVIYIVYVRRMRVQNGHRSQPGEGEKS